MTDDVAEEAKKLAESLDRFESLLKKKYDSDRDKVFPCDDADRLIYDALAVRLCKLTKMIVPNVQRKIDEIVYANEKKMTVCADEHGADLNDDEGNHHELKVSACKKSTNYKCNFNWPMPAGKSVDVRRTRLLESVIEKTKGNQQCNLDKITIVKTEKECETKTTEELRLYRGGEFKMVVKDARGMVTLNEYSLSGIFVYHYFKRLPEFSRSTAYNFGCERCAKCNEYHRLKRLTKYDAKMLDHLSARARGKNCTKVVWIDESEENAFMDVHVPWKKIFSKIKSQCK